jgi:hypothetical protein
MAIFRKGVKSGQRENIDEDGAAATERDSGDASALHIARRSKF